MRQGYILNKILHSLHQPILENSLLELNLKRETRGKKGTWNNFLDAI